jgi:hypothetical protein
MDDFHSDRVFHQTLWRLFHHPETKASLGDKATIYESQLARCQRLIEKSEQIEDEKESNRREYFKMLGCPEPDDIGNRDPEEVKRNLIAKLSSELNARKGRKRIVLKARRSSETEKHRVQFGK